MPSRAYLSLAREYRELERNNHKGISAFPVREDLMEWEADIEGLQDTIWQGLFFHLKINFTLKYNLVPPTVKFTTIPFHPNVDQHTGQPCIDFLNNPNEWNPRYTLSSILLTLQVMLSNPVLENPVNLEAAKLFTKDESKYRLTVLRLFQEPLQLKDDSPNRPKSPAKSRRSTKTISFYDYYKSWCEIATSKVTGSPRTTLLEDPSFIGEYLKLKKNEQKRAKEWNSKYAVIMARLTKEKKKSYYKNSYPTERKHHFPTPIYFSPQSQSETEIVTNIYESDANWKSEELIDFDESWEEEVDDLVAWTNTLDIGRLQE